MLSIGRKVASGWSRTNSTWWSPLFSTRSISSGSCIDWACGKPFCATLCQGLVGSSMRWKLNTTSSASRVRLGLK